jgi:alpha-glucosidase
MLDVLRFWLDRGVDGFRIDVAHMLMKDPELRDNPPSTSGANPFDLQHPDFAGQRQVHDRMHPDLHGVLRDIRAVLDEYDGDRVAIGEIEAMDWETWARYYGEELDELHLPFAFRLIETAWDARAVAAVVAELEGALPDGAWPILALGNHDRPRLATRLGRPQARVAAMLLLTLRGTPTLLYGDELGMVDQDVPVERQRDWFGLGLGGVSRDPTRTPMPWDDGPNAGFSPADEARLWLPISREHRTLNVAAQAADARSSLTLYRRLIALRREGDALATGRWAAHQAGDDACVAYVREAGEERKLVVLNLTGAARTVDLRATGTIVLSTHLDREAEPVDGVVGLRADEGVVIDTGRAR